MPHLSSRPLDKKIQKHIKKQFAQLFKFTANKGVTESVITELFTDTEQIMLAKRLAAIFMLTQGYSRYRIGKTLRLSESTVARLEFAREEGVYENIEKVFTDQKNSIDFWKILKAVFNIMPPRVGPGRYRVRNKLHAQHLERKKKQYQKK